MQRTLYHYATNTEARREAEKGDLEAQRELIIRLSFNKAAMPVVNADTLYLAETILKFEPGLAEYKSICYLLLAEDCFAKKNYKKAADLLVEARSERVLLNAHQVAVVERKISQLSFDLAKTHLPNNVVDAAVWLAASLSISRTNFCEDAMQAFLNNTFFPPNTNTSALQLCVYIWARMKCQFENGWKTTWIQVLETSSVRTSGGPPRSRFFYVDKPIKTPTLNADVAASAWLASLDKSIVSSMGLYCLHTNVLKLLDEVILMASTSEGTPQESGQRDLFEFFKRCYERYLLAFENHEKILNKYFIGKTLPAVTTDVVAHLATVSYESGNPGYEVYLAKLTDPQKRNNLFYLWLRSALTQTKTHARALALYDKLGSEFFNQLLAEKPQEYIELTLQLVEAAKTCRSPRTFEFFLMLEKAGNASSHSVHSIWAESLKRDCKKPVKVVQCAIAACVFLFEQHVKERADVSIWQTPIRFFEVKLANVMDKEDETMARVHRDLEGYLDLEVTDENVLELWRQFSDAFKTAKNQLPMQDQTKPSLLSECVTKMDAVSDQVQRRLPTLTVSAEYGAA